MKEATWEYMRSIDRGILSIRIFFASFEYFNSRYLFKNQFPLYLMLVEENFFANFEYFNSRYLFKNQFPLYLMLMNC